MLAILIMILLAVAAAGTASYAGLAMFETARQGVMVQSNQARMQQIAAQLRIYARPLGMDGVLRLPAPASVSHTDSSGTTRTYAGLNPNLFPNNRTPWGVPYHYCPLALQSPEIGGTAGTVAYPGGGAYNIRTRSSVLSGNSGAYVVASDIFALAAGSLPPGMVGLLVSPRWPDEVPPPCTAISYSNGQFTHASGVVVPIYSGQPSLMPGTQADEERVWFVAPAATGDRSGRDVNNRATLEAALQAWRAARPRVARMELDAGTFNLSRAMVNSDLWGGDYSDLRNSHLAFIGQGPFTTTLSPSAGAEATAGVPVKFPGNLYFRNIRLSGNSWLYIPPGRRVWQQIAPMVTEVDGGYLFTNENDWIFNQTGNKPTLNISNAGMALISDPTFPDTSFVGPTSSTAPGIRVQNGQLFLQGSVASSASVIGSNDVEIGNGGMVSIMSGANFLLDNNPGCNNGVQIAKGGGFYTISGGVVSHGVPCSSVFDVAGQLVYNSGFTGSSDTATNYITLRNGGKLSFNATMSGANRPANGINDLGGSFVGGTGTIRVTTACWRNPATAPLHLFSASQAHGAGNNSQPLTADSEFPFLRLANRSSFTCTP